MVLFDERTTLTPVLRLSCMDYDKRLPFWLNTMEPAVKLTAQLHVAR